MAEQRFRWRVDIEVPELGLGNRLTGMMDWCEAQLVGDRWDQHGVSGGRRPDGTPRDLVRFYFAERDAAQAFALAWGGMLRLA